ncbi:NADPH-dependent FMN reductase (plasmid) [Rhizobium leguminosarum bv. trifolii WSM2304]|uniref:NADPH-dependent FMN reductase n=1 Tax=Rhizobium leguminosarum bv. trifolii (strain WSM2304) TaxID=395492 RepID=A0ABF7QZQ9_RHILW|nr:NAD(P)H-dependent oxidoreductase [Rhizobium leguminosarum]ACI59497.1 NADPH-dependent FMN reductase [Rhizobium leguminosarum bv. trifolii WSM2304]
MSNLIVGMSGNFSRPSKTRTLVTTVVEETAQQLGRQSVVYDLVDAAAGLAQATSSTSDDPQLQRMWQDVIGCDVLVVGSPVYKASYSGLLKHFFDLIDMNALKGKPVAVVATARAPQHALMIEHQFKPLFGFFGARVAANSIFATDEAFLENGKLSDRTELLAKEVARDLVALAGT